MLLQIDTKFGQPSTTHSIYFDHLATLSASTLIIALKSMALPLELFVHHMVNAISHLYLSYKVIIITIPEWQVGIPYIQVIGYGMVSNSDPIMMLT